MEGIAELTDTTHNFHVCWIEGMFHDRRRLFMLFMTETSVIICYYLYVKGSTQEIHSSNC